MNIQYFQYSIYLFPFSIRVLDKAANFMEAVDECKSLSSFLITLQQLRKLRNGKSLKKSHKSLYRVNAIKGKINQDIIPNSYLDNDFINYI